MRVTIERKLEQSGWLRRILGTSDTLYTVVVKILFTNAELVVIEERSLSKYVMFEHHPYAGSRPIKVNVTYFVEGDEVAFGFDDLGEADQFERTAKAAVANLKKYIEATGTATSRTETYEL